MLRCDVGRDRTHSSPSRPSKLVTSLADVDHLARGRGQWLLLPATVPRADAKPIVEEQGFDLLGEDIAQRDALRLLHPPPSWMKPPILSGVVLDLRHRIVDRQIVSDRELPAIRRCVLVWARLADTQEIVWGGVARLEEKIPFRAQMFPHTRQQSILVRSRQEELEGVSYHVKTGKPPRELERARVRH